MKGVRPDELRRKEVAKAVGAMMTAAFVRLREVSPAAPKMDTVPITGAVVDSLNLSTDVLFDPIDGRAATMTKSDG